MILPDRTGGLRLVSFVGFSFGKSLRGSSSNYLTSSLDIGSIVAKQHRDRVALVSCFERSRRLIKIHVEHFDWLRSSIGGRMIRERIDDERRMLDDQFDGQNEFIWILNE